LHLYPSSDRLKITLVTKFSGDFRPVCRGRIILSAFVQCLSQSDSKAVALRFTFLSLFATELRPRKAMAARGIASCAICIYRNCICSLSETSVAKSRFIVLLRAEAPEQLPEALAVLLLLVALPVPRQTVEEEAGGDLDHPAPPVLFPAARATLAPALSIRMIGAEGLYQLPLLGVSRARMASKKPAFAFSSSARA